MLISKSGIRPGLVLAVVPALVICAVAIIFGLTDKKETKAATYSADINQDGIVDVLDLSLVMSQWGTHTATTSASPTPTPTPSTGSTLPSGGTTITAYVTGYSYWDNDPPGSAQIAYPIIHTVAAGVGTFTNPITLAVATGKFSPGVKFYLPFVRRYFIVEDQCAGCGTAPSGTSAWIDMWIDGRNGTTTSTDACMNALTGNRKAIYNAPNGYAVVSGALYGTTCTSTYSETLTAGPPS
jgi:hypothetical protein